MKLPPELQQSLYGVGAALFTFFAAWFKAWLRKQAHRFDEDAISHNMLIRDILVEARLHFNSDRAQLLLFKNGTYYMSGKSEQKLCLAYCVNGPGVAFPTTQDTPVTFILPTLQKLTEAPYYEGSVADDPSEYIRTVSGPSSGTKHYVMAFVGPAGRPHAVLAVSWLEDTKCQSPVDILPFSARLAPLITK